VEEGRLHLAAVCLLAPHLTPENADELIEMATHQRKSEAERRLAERSRNQQMLQLVASIPATQAAVGQPTTSAWKHLPEAQVVPTHEHLVWSQCPGDTRPHRIDHFAHPDGATCRGALRFHLSVGKRFHDKLRQAQELLSHAVPSGDIERCSNALSMP